MEKPMPIQNWRVESDIPIPFDLNKKNHLAHVRESYINALEKLLAQLKEKDSFVGEDEKEPGPKYALPTVIFAQSGMTPSTAPHYIFLELWCYRDREDFFKYFYEPEGSVEEEEP